MTLPPIKKEPVALCDYPMAKPPRFREYYPRFNLYEARREIQRGRDLCEFWTVGQKVGELVVREDQPGESMTIQWGNGLKHVARRGLQRFEFVANPTPDNERREAIRCPRCGKPRLVMFCVASWACAQCHHLRLRSQLVHPLALKAEKLEQLEREIAAGRRKGTHKSTFRKLLARHRELRSGVDSHPHRKIGLKHALVTETRWLVLAEVGDRFFV